MRRLAEASGDDFSVRVDCALVPLLGDVLGDPAVLARFGVFGCEAGRHLGAWRRDGARVGCSFDTWSPGGAEEFRAYANDPPSPCQECPCARSAGQLQGGLDPRRRGGPRPECPRAPPPGPA
ncbi:MAG: hypothetical protein R3A48_25370 [Polyangiales bacterium]